MKDKLLHIIKKYGVIPQLKYFQSEVFELNEAIIRHEDYFYEKYNFKVGLKYLEHIAEEIADCYVMLEQFRIYYDIPNDKIKEIMEYKVDRQLSRIAKEKE